MLGILYANYLREYLQGITEFFDFFDLSFLSRTKTSAPCVVIAGLQISLKKGTAKLSTLACDIN